MQMESVSRSTSKDLRSKMGRRPSILLQRGVTTTGPFLLDSLGLPEAPVVADGAGSDTDSCAPSAESRRGSRAGLHERLLKDCPSCKESEVQEHVTKATCCSGLFGDDFMPPGNGIVANIMAGVIAGLKIVLGMVAFSSLTFGKSELPAVADLFPTGINMNMLSAVICLSISALFSNMNILSSPQDIPALLLAELIEHLAEQVQPENLKATALAAVWLTALVGGVFVLVLGSLKVGPMFQKIPTPVIGGFVATLGFQTLKSAISILLSTRFWVDGSFDVASLSLWTTWAHFLLGLYALFSIRYLPFYVKAHVKEPFLQSIVGPCCLISPMIAFYAVLAMRGQVSEDLDSLRAFGWVYQKKPTEPFYMVWSHTYDWSRVEWSAFTDSSYAVTDLVLILLSTLAAILGIISGAEEIPARAPLDLDRELQVMGLQNVLVGAAGGNLGYVQMGLSVNLVRDGGTHRVSHLAAVLFVLGVFMSSVQVSSFVPKFFLQGIFLNLGMGFIKSNLVDQFGRMDSLSYWSMYVVVACGLAFTLQTAVFVGLIIQAALMLTISSRSEPVAFDGTTDFATSSRLRTCEERQVLLRSKLLRVIRLRGSLFFGVSPKLLSRCEEVLREAKPVPKHIIIDLKEVTFVDDTAIQVFAKVGQAAARLGARLYYSGAGEWEWLLERQGYHRFHSEESCENGSEPALFEVLDDALEVCEELILEEFRAEKEKQETNLPAKRQGSSPSLRVQRSFHPLDKSPHLMREVTLLGTLSEEVLQQQSMMPPEQWEKLRQRATLLELEAGDVVFSAGDACDAVHILVAGAVEVVREAGRDRQRVRRVMALAVLGTNAFMCTSQPKHVLTAVVSSSVGASLLRLGKEQVDALRREDKDLYISFVDSLLIRSLGLEARDAECAPRCGSASC